MFVRPWLEHGNCSLYGNDEVLSIPFHVFLPSTAFTVLLISVFGVSLNVKSTVPVSDTSTPPSDPVAVAWLVPPEVELAGACMRS